VTAAGIAVHAAASAARHREQGEQAKDDKVKGEEEKHG
jgi:hypothetical protein